MAFVALFAFFADLQGESVQGSGLGNVSSFDSDAISHLDAWMQRMLDGRYPSLSAVVVCDGEVVYQGTFGLEDFKADR